MMSHTHKVGDLQLLLEEYNNFLQECSHYQGNGEGSIEELNYLILGLAGESGEVIELMKKHARNFGIATDKGSLRKLPHMTKIRMIDELGDILWYLIKLTTVLDVSLVDVIELNVRKLRGRQPHLAWPFTEIPLRITEACTNE